METEGILEHVREISPYFQERLQALAKFSIVGDVRGMGLLGCIEGSAETLDGERRLGALLDAACEELGLLVRPLINMAVFSPPLIITKDQIDEMFDILELALQKVTVPQVKLKKPVFVDGLFCLFIRRTGNAVTSTRKNASVDVFQ